MGRRWRTRRRRQREREEAVAAVASGQQQLPQEMAIQRKDYSPEVITFLRWLKACGFRNEHRLQVYHFGPGQGRGIMTNKKGINAGDCLMSLPAQCMMLPSVLRAKMPQLYGYFTIDEDCLVVALMHERSLIEAGLPSDWAPYINIIPRDYSYLPISEPTVLARYAGLPLPKLFCRVVSATIMEQERTRSRVCKIMRQNGILADFKLEHFLWAYSVVNTRCVHPNPQNMKQCADQTALVPFFDFFNHAPFGNAHVETVASEECFRLFTHAPFKRYSQVYISYHTDLCNRDFYVFYGFTMIRNIMPDAPTDPHILHVCPCPQDMVVVPCGKLKQILQQAIESKPEFAYLQQRLDKHFEKLLQLDCVKPMGDAFKLKWPSQLLANVNVHFCGSQVTFEHAIEKRVIYPSVDLASLNSNVDTRLEFLFSFLSKREWPNANGYVNGKTGEIEKVDYNHNYIMEAEDSDQYASEWSGDYGDEWDDSGSTTLLHNDEHVEELTALYRLKSMLIKGLLSSEFGFDPEEPVTPAAVNAYLAQLEPMDRQAKLVFRNELGLLLFLHYQIEQNMPPQC